MDGAFAGLVKGWVFRAADAQRVAAAVVGAGRAGGEHVGPGAAIGGHESFADGSGVLWIVEGGQPQDRIIDVAEFGGAEKSSGI